MMLSRLEIIDVRQLFANKFQRLPGRGRTTSLSSAAMKPTADDPWPVPERCCTSLMHESPGCTNLKPVNP